MDGGPVVEHVARLGTLGMKALKNVLVEVDREAPAPLLFQSVEGAGASTFCATTSQPTKMPKAIQDLPHGDLQTQERGK